MDISLERRFLSSFKLIGSGKKVCDISSDIVVPDTKEDILRVIMTNAEYSIRSKDVESGRAVMHGELKVTVVYVPESGDGLCTLSTDIPFECEFEVSSADSGCAVVAELDVISVDTRILNPRKVMINAQVGVSQKCYCNCDFSWYTAPAETPKNTFLRNSSADIRLINLVTEKTFSLENSFVPQGIDNDAQLVAASVYFCADSAEAVGSKLIVKGHADIKAVFCSRANIQIAETTQSFSQIFELPERDIMPDYTVDILPTGDFFELKDGNVSFEIHAVMQIVCTETKAIEFVEDAYVCGAETALDEEDRTVCISERTLCQTETAQFTQSADFDIEKVLYLSGIVGTPKVSDGELTVPLTVEGVCTSVDEQIRSVKLHGSAKFELEIEENETIDSTSACISSLKSSINGKDLTVTAAVAAQVQLKQTRTLQIVSSMTVTEPKESIPTASVYMCMAQTNDLWDIAKHYSSDIEMIIALNELDEDADIVGRLLIIPRIK